MAKLFVTLAILCVFGAALVRGFDEKEAAAHFMSILGECKPNVGAKDADVEEILGKKPASTMEGQCLRACIMKKYGVMDSNGKFDKAVGMSLVEKYTDGDAEKMKIGAEIGDFCSTIAVSDDPCEASTQYLNCFKDQAKVHGVEDQLQF